MAVKGGEHAMVSIPRFASMMGEKIWTEDEKQQWLASHGGVATHVVTFEPMFQVELCIPPWEQPDRQIARSAVAWGKAMSRVLDEEQFGAAAVVATHHEGNSLEVSTTMTRRPRLRRIT
jgi:hypothetical protein